MIGLDYDEIMKSEDSKTDFANYLSGNKLFPHSVTLSHNYCGH